MIPSDKISCLICCYSIDEEHDRMLLRALDCLTGEEWPNEVVLVLDECWPQTLKAITDWKNDRTNEYIVRTCPIHIYERPKKEGLASAKNYGIERCNYEWIAYCDADDWWDEYKLKLQKEYLLDNPAVDFCFTEAWDVYKDGTQKPNCFKVGQYMTDEQIKSRLPAENVLAHGSMLGRKRAILDLGGYRDIKGKEDYDFWKRAAIAGYRFFKFPARLYYYSMGTGVSR